MTTRILVPLDGSLLAEQALACAITLGRALPAELLLLRVVSVPPETADVLDSAGLETAMLAERLDSEADAYLREVAVELRDVGLTVDHAVRHGPVSEVIVDYAAGHDVDQIVMTTHGRTGVSRWTHGSIAERVLQSATVPLLLVRAREREPAAPRTPVLLRRILVPLDGSAVAEQVLPWVTTAAGALGAHVILFQVPVVYLSGWLLGEFYIPIHGILETAEKDAQAYLDGVADRLIQQGVDVSTGMRIGTVAEAIISYASANAIDLIAMCTHGRTGLDRWTLGSVADRVLRGSRTPILLVRAH